jgi:cytidylate kinase
LQLSEQKERYDELIEKGMWLLLKRYLKNVEERDYIDTHRDNSPLVLAEDAIEIDNSPHTRRTISDCLRVGS